MSLSPHCFSLSPSPLCPPLALSPPSTLKSILPSKKKDFKGPNLCSAHSATALHTSAPTPHCRCTPAAPHPQLPPTALTVGAGALRAQGAAHCPENYISHNPKRPDHLPLEMVGGGGPGGPGAGPGLLKCPACVLVGRIRFERDLGSREGRTPVPVRCDSVPRRLSGPLRVNGTGSGPKGTPAARGDSGE